MTIRKLILILSLLIGTSAFAETVAVIGTGNVGGALGTELAQQGHTIIYGSRSPLGLKALDLARKRKVTRQRRHRKRRRQVPASLFSPCLE